MENGNDISVVNDIPIVNDIPTVFVLKQQRWDKDIKDIISEIKKKNLEPAHNIKSITLVNRSSVHTQLLTDEFTTYIVNLFESKGYIVVVNNNTVVERPAHVSKNILISGRYYDDTVKTITISW